MFFKAKMGKDKPSLITITLVVAFLILFAFTFYLIDKERAVLVQAELDQKAYIFSTNFYKKLNKATEDLQAVSNVMLHFKNIQFDQFKGITDGYFKSKHGLVMIEWQPIVLAAEREKFIKEVQNGGLTNFDLWEPDANGKPITAKRRDLHIPVLFMSSRNSNNNDDLNTLGLDLAWSSERTDSKLKARDLGRAQGSELFKVITGKQSDYDPLGFAITLPVYKDGVVPVELADKRSEILGFIASVYTLEGLFKLDIEQMTHSGINIEIYDSLKDDDRLVIKSGNSSSFERETSLDMFGNKLHIKFTATDSFVTRHFQSISLALPLMMFAFGILTIIFFKQLQAKTQKLLQAHKELEQLNLKLEDLSRHDSLTQLLNRRAFLETLSKRLNSFNRHKDTIALLMIDIDHFKQINDQWGHPAGDHVLKEFSRSCEEVLRKADVMGRIGGEEFAILLMETNQEDALSMAERLRLHISGFSIPMEADNRFAKITVSIGVVLTDHKIPSKQLIMQADKALYLAKDAGRDQVQLFS